MIGEDTFVDMVGKKGVALELNLTTDEYDGICRDRVSTGGSSGPGKGRGGGGVGERGDEGADSDGIEVGEE